MGGDASTDGPTGTIVGDMNRPASSTSNVDFSNARAEDSTVSSSTRSMTQSTEEANQSVENASSSLLVSVELARCASSSVSTNSVASIPDATPIVSSQSPGSLQNKPEGDGIVSLKRSLRNPDDDGDFESVKKAKTGEDVDVTVSGQVKELTPVDMPDSTVRDRIQPDEKCEEAKTSSPTSIEWESGSSIYNCGNGSEDKDVVPQREKLGSSTSPGEKHFQYSCLSL